MTSWEQFPGLWMNTGIARDGEGKTGVKWRRELSDRGFSSQISCLFLTILPRDPRRAHKHFQHCKCTFGLNLIPAFSRNVYTDGFCDPFTLLTIGFFFFSPRFYKQRGERVLTWLHCSSQNKLKRKRRTASLLFSFFVCFCFFFTH